MRWRVCLCSLKWLAVFLLGLMAKMKSRKRECSLCEFAMKTHFCRVFVTSIFFTLLLEFFRSFFASSFEAKEEKKTFCAKLQFIYFLVVCYVLGVVCAPGFIIFLCHISSFAVHFILSFSLLTVSFSNFIPFATLSARLF